MASEPAEESGGVQDPYSDASAKYGPLKLPELQNVDLSKMYGGAAQGKEPEYLDYNIKGRGFWERMPYNAGALYITGILGGGAAGVREGFAKAPNRRSRVLLNSIMNHAGKKGSFYGNTFAVLATYYTCAETLLDHFEVDQMGPVQQAGLGEIINPLLAGASTGLLYKSSAGPRLALMASVAGLGAVGVAYAVDKTSASVLGQGIIF
ncbi:unnamed protein product [Ectocarpus sp. 6 AP-2014]